MKKQSLIFSLAALTLFSCGGSSTQKQNNADNPATEKTDTVKQTDAVQNVSSTENKTAEKIPFAAEIAKRIGENFYGALEATIGRENDDWKYQEHIAYENMALDCFPLKSGGYFVIQTEIAMCDCEYETYKSYVYSKSELKANNILLPCPKINDFYSNADKFPEAVREELEEKILTKTRYRYDSGALNITFDPYNCNEDNPESVLAEPIKGLELKNGNIVPVILYNWDGEKFVRESESKPLEENLKYFSDQAK